MADSPIRIAMWSGPRNISTAMMRAWGSRADTFVCDEPFYAHYLEHTGLPHPGAQEVIDHHETNLEQVIDFLTGPIPQGKTIFFQKQMTHHLLPHIDMDWLTKVTNCFLIRDPEDMITSLIHFIPQPTLLDTGVPQQARIFDWVCEHTDQQPPVIDSKDVLLDPKRMLTQLCKRVGVAFTDDMLHWEPGSRATDGIWAKHWYAAVEKTTGFAPYQPKNVPVPDSMQELLKQCHALYEKMYERRITL